MDTLVALIRETIPGRDAAGLRTPSKAEAAQLLTWIRSYWGIENGLHYRRDVTLHWPGARPWLH